MLGDFVTSGRVSLTPECSLDDGIHVGRGGIAGFLLLHTIRIPLDEQTLRGRAEIIRRVLDTQFDLQCTGQPVNRRPAGLSILGDLVETRITTVGLIQPLLRSQYHFVRHNFLLVGKR